MATLGATGSIWLHMFEGMCTDHADWLCMDTGRKRAHATDDRRKVLSYFDKQSQEKLNEDKSKALHGQL